ncbi:hypothetical protein NPIL_513691 [Nephila pilipes]|uniref:Uncharacterized protein n=1 Tax=Nephila pilipes TaxID=299642 RepID=A0A8X6TSR4_NEPPI|nr:hypothetical protein NPIL_513691 [Nephila pilipes]
MRKSGVPNWLYIIHACTVFGISSNTKSIKIFALLVLLKIKKIRLRKQDSILESRADKCKDNYADSGNQCYGKETIKHSADQSSEEDHLPSRKLWRN